jgi:hypothetical protein
MRMRTLALAAFFVGSAALVACGGDDDDGPMIDGDGGPPMDAGPTAACNPVNQTGCAAGERCTSVTYQVMPDLRRRTECVADGTVDEGGACTEGMPGADTGFDDCKAGLYCVNDVCTNICTQNDSATCPESFSCVTYEATFDDFGADKSIGLCAPVCDPVTQDCAVESQGCFVRLDAGAGTCAGVSEEAAMKHQGDICYGPEMGMCYLNGCDKGYQAILLENADSNEAVCSAFCTPGDTYVGYADSEVQGVGEANCGVGRVQKSNQGCAFLQGIYRTSTMFDATVIPVAYGICYDGDAWGKCDEYDPTGMVAAWNEGYDGSMGTEDEKVTAAQAALETFCMVDGTGFATAPACISGWGCISIATYETIFSGLKGTEMSAKRFRALHDSFRPMMDKKVGLPAGGPVDLHAAIR